MNRLVIDGKPVLNGTEPLYKREQQIFDKVEEVEEIEEELGIGLTILYKAIRNGIFVKRGRAIKFYRPELGHEIDFEFKRFNVFNTNKWDWESYPFDTYGQCWALTKGELKK